MSCRAVVGVLALAASAQAARPSDCAPCGADSACWDEACFDTAVVQGAAPAAASKPDAVFALADGKGPTLAVIASDAKGKIVAATVELWSTNQREVQVFQRGPSRWTKLSSLRPLDRAERTFGSALAWSADGSTLAVASGRGSALFPATRAPSTTQGLVYLYRQQKGAWRQAALLTLEGEHTHEPNALALSANGDTLAVATAFEGPGRVRLFQAGSEIGGWSLQALIESKRDETSALRFGASLSLDASGDGLAVASRVESSFGPANTPSPDWVGAAAVYRRQGERWSQPQEAEPPPGARDFGDAVLLSGDGRVLAVSAPTEVDRGSIYLYQWADSRWQLRHRLVLSARGMALSSDGQRARVRTVSTVYEFSCSDPTAIRAVALIGTQKLVSWDPWGEASLPVSSGNVVTLRLADILEILELPRSL